MKIDVEHIAHLSKLSFNEEEKVKMEKELGSIIELVEHLPDVKGDLNGAEIENRMELREDEILPSMKREELLKNAPEVKAGCLVVPQTVEQ
jgi:aspartyl-tRNA(Asn)/glutamyl-tRNA(Gln) amidotransferase subunit C